MLGDKWFASLVPRGRPLALTVAVAVAITACQYQPPELSNVADPNGATPVEEFPVGLNDPLREAILNSAEIHGYEYTQDIAVLEADGAGLESLDGVEFLFSLE
ncbi:MAG: hypothetical protein ACLFM0_11510, partial [Spirochaetales bacterium]